MATKLPVTDIIRRAGGNTVIGIRIGRTPQAVSKWIRAGYVPVDHVAIIEALSGIPRHLIRPDRPDLFPPPRKRAA